MILQAFPRKPTAVSHPTEIRRIRPCMCSSGICPVVFSLQKLVVVTQMCWTGHWPCFNLKYGTVIFGKLDLKGICTFRITVERLCQDMFIEKLSVWTAISSILLLYHSYCNLCTREDVAIVLWAGEIMAILLQDSHVTLFSAITKCTHQQTAWHRGG